jgi:penicillin G amidase
MSVTTTPLPVPPEVQRRGWRILGLLLALFLLLAVIGATWLYRFARASLPQLDGVAVVGKISAPVQVIRDAHGVPTIEAATLEDLFFAQGYVTAQDRLWQMDTMRRYAAGELAEIFGPDLVKHDRQQRILGLRLVAQRSAAALSARDRSFFEAYARGVNTFISSHNERLPLEFRLLRYAPRPWSIEDSILIGASMVEDLNHGSYESALEREKILAKLGPELTAELYVNSSWHDRPPETEGKRTPKQDLQKDDGDDDDSDEMNPVAALRGSKVSILGAPLLPPPADPVLTPGSNNWVVAGMHTVTGKPLLSNDMHLNHQMPNLWFEAHLKVQDFDVAGVTLPGMPYVIVGHNRRIAWGFTNIGPTVEDLYIETFNPAGQYQTPTGWKDPEKRSEVIHVKGQPDVTVEVVTTRHGPIITELIPGESRKIALRWTLYDSLYDPFFEVDSAQNWDEFRKAFSQWDSPGQNVVYADMDGHIGYQATGHIPIRKSGDGTVPADGSSDTQEWTGYIPFEKLPSVYDPPLGVIATANGRITPDGYSYLLSNEWGSPWRTERIYRVLESGKKLNTADMLALQTDVYSAFDRFCAERFVYALDHAQNLSKRAKQARDLMRDWDGRLLAESPAATIEYRSRQELVRLLLEPRLGAAPESDKAEPALSWKSYHWWMSSAWLENVLLKHPKRWLPEKYASYEDLLAAAVEAAVTDKSAPRDLASWHWGQFSPVVIRHPVLSQVPFVGRWTSPGSNPQSGGSYTVKQVGRNFGPSERLTVDFSNLDQSTLNLVTGQAGNFLSPYYMDQWDAWYKGTTLTLPFSPEAVRAQTKNHLVLEPTRPE